MYLCYLFVKTNKNIILDGDLPTKVICTEEKLYTKLTL